MAQARRKVLHLAICAISHEAGFSSAEDPAVDLLTVMLQSLITELARESQLLAEHNGRSEATPDDVILAMIDSGLTVDSLAEYGRRRNPIRIPTPGREHPQRQPAILQAAPAKALHAYIPEHFPPFPDPQSYIRTPTHRQPTSEYEAIRDKAATQKRDLERALTRFVAKTCNQQPGHSLFGNNESLNKYFPLIGIPEVFSEEEIPLPFVTALIPKDQVFDDEEDTK